MVGIEAEAMPGIEAKPGNRDHRLYSRLTYPRASAIPTAKMRAEGASGAKRERMRGGGARPCAGRAATTFFFSAMVSDLKMRRVPPDRARLRLDPAHSGFERVLAPGVQGARLFRPGRIDGCGSDRVAGADRLHSPRRRSVTFEPPRRSPRYWKSAGLGGLSRSMAGWRDGIATK